MLNIALQIANELSVREDQIQKTIELTKEGATIPFIARYRKEVTGGLNDVQLREFENRFIYLTDLEDRKQTVLKGIEAKGKLTPELEEKINNCLIKSDLEDLYLPFKEKRTTKATKAREAGLEPIAQQLWTSNDPNLDIESILANGINEKYTNNKEVLEGCLYICMEDICENADLLKQLKNYINTSALITSKATAECENNAEANKKYKDYFDYSEEVKNIKSHRLLALLRGRKEKFLNLSLNTNPQELAQDPAETIIKNFVLSINPVDLDTESDLNLWRNKVITWSWKTKLSNSLENDIISIKREQAEEESINVFANNLKALLLQSPAINHVVLGLDPGIRTGIKVAVVSETSKLLYYTTTMAYNTTEIAKAKKELAKICKEYNVTLIAIGNGTASRETFALAKEMIEENGLSGKIHPITVNEAGASVYSASKLATTEFPELEAAIRGAISIARRLQDPLAELVKIEPKSIGVGQYQHDLNQSELSRKLEAVVEDCVNYVGCDVNTASASLLSHISGIRSNIATKIVEHREEQGRFNTRKDILKVSGLGAKAFEQCAGFLRILGGSNILDNSSVHPESYNIVEKMAQDLNTSVEQLIGNKELIDQIKPTDYITDKIGLPTINDILIELQKPGRDPRGEFESIQFKEGVESIKDLEVGMILNGLVTNVTNFGAFVDIGVHQDALIHISNLSSQFIENPADFIKPGEKVKVQVLKVDLDRNRIDLTMVFDGANSKSNSKTKGKVKSNLKENKLTKPNDTTKEGKKSINFKSNKNRSHQATVNKSKTNNFKPKPNNSFNNAFSNAFAQAFEKSKSSKS